MVDRKHIAHFSNTYHPVTSGVVRSVSTFRQALTELGHNVFVFAQQSSDYEDKEPFVFRYAAVELPLLPDFPVTIPISNFVDKLLPRLKLDVIHTHHPFLLGQTAARKAAELDVPLVFTFHTRYREYSHYVAMNQTLVKKAITGWLGDYMQKCHHIVVPSQGIKQILENRYGIQGQISVVPTGIDLAPYKEAKGEPIRQKHGWGDDTVLISVGRLAKEKNWHTLISAVAQVMRQHDNVRLVLIGDGEDRNELAKYVQELGVADSVEFTGRVPFDDIPRYLSAADLFCFASITETQGLVTMEAIAAGLPVVAMDATGTKDVIDNGKEGFLTDNDSEALAKAIEQMLQDESLRKKFSQAALKTAETFEMKIQAKKLLTVYDQAREAHQANRPVQVTKGSFKLIDEEHWYKMLGVARR